MVNGLVAVVMLLYLVIVGHKIKIEHSYYTTGLGLAYSIFSLGYYLGGGTDRNMETKIYPLLDWNAPGHTICICVAGIIFVFTVHVVCCILCKVRGFIHDKLFVQKRAKNENNSLIGFENRDFTIPSIIDLK